jgi:hypothetical protein
MQVISLVAYEDRIGKFIFVLVPNQRGRYLRTDRSVITVACPHCKSIIGEPCTSTQGYGGQTHHVRRLQAKLIKTTDRGE